MDDANGGAARTHAPRAIGGREVPQWTFLTNHAHVLLCIAADPAVRLRDVATSVGITERAAQRIVADLVEAGYLDRERVGRRNLYRTHPEKPLRHPNEQHHAVGELLGVLSIVDGGAEGAPGEHANGNGNGHRARARA